MFRDESSGFYNSEFESLDYGSHEFPYAMAAGSEFSSLESGDPYRELDDASRGVSMGQPLGGDSFWLAGLNDCKPGSFVNKEASCTHNSLLPGGGYEYSPFETAPLFFERSTSSACTSILTPSQEIFQSHHLPPSPPSNKHFFFVPTTLFVKDCSPQKIGNSLLDFFTSQVVASVAKVRLEKYAIKAEVFDESKSCMMKVRVYTHEDICAVEVQRKGGDAFVLQSTYGLLCAYLEAHCGGLSGQESEYMKPVELTPVPALDLDIMPQEVIVPLLAMATTEGLEIEAACGLAELAKGGRTSAAPLLGSPDEVASALTHLLASSNIHTVYPVACCVSALAVFGEAGPLLAHQGLLQAAANQAVAELAGTQGLVGTALAQAVVDAVKCCAGLLTAAAAVEIQEVLDTALKNETLTKCDVVSRSHLEQALYDTRLIA